MSLTEQRTPSSRVGVSTGPSGPALFSVDATTTAGETVLMLHGELDLSTQPLFASAFARIDETVPSIVLDLSDLTFIDCSNIGLIHDARVAAGARGVRLQLRAPRPDLRRILELTGLIAASGSARIQHRVVLTRPLHAQQASA